MSALRKSITLFDDQYNFYKELKSKKLLIAFVEYMFEDIEPQGLSNLEQITFNSLRKRMENSKKKSFAWSMSKWWWRPRKYSWELNVKNNTKTTEQTTQKQEEEDNILKIYYKEEDKKEINKEKKTYPSVVELVRAMESNDKLMRMFSWTDEVKQRLEYKQAKKDRAYKTIPWFIQQMQVIFKDITMWEPRWDIPWRFRFAVNLAMENERKGIFRDEKIESKYKSFKSMNRTQDE